VKKEEVIGLHAVLLAMRMKLEKRGLVSPNSFPEYDRLGVKPTHIHLPKEAQARALRILAKELGTVTLGAAAGEAYWKLSDA
jgi:hypothetical protein